MKKNLLFLLVLMSIGNFPVWAQSPYKDMDKLASLLYPNYFDPSVMEKLIGNTLTVTFPDRLNKAYDEFLLPKPDTTWISKRNKRNAKIGTDYTVKYNYSDDPKNDIEGVKFKIRNLTREDNYLLFRLLSTKHGDEAIWKIKYNPNDRQNGNINYVHIEEIIAPVREKFNGSVFYVNQRGTSLYGPLGTKYSFQDIDMDKSSAYFLTIKLISDANKSVSINIFTLTNYFYCEDEYNKILTNKKRQDELEARKKEYQQKYEIANSSNREEIVLPTLLTNKYPPIIKPRLWSYNSSIAKWEYSDQIYDTYDWIKWGELKYDSTTYKLLMWELDGGYYEYPAVQVGWVSTKVRRFFAITDQEFNDAKAALINGKDTSITISSYLYGMGSTNSKIANRDMTLELIKAIYYCDKYEENNIRRFKLQIATVNNKKYVRFKIPEVTYTSIYTNHDEDFTQSYYEVPLATFVSMFNSIK